MMIRKFGRSSSLNKVLIVVQLASIGRSATTTQSKAMAF
jgi:hypothetical protein